VACFNSTENFKSQVQFSQSNKKHPCT